MKSYEWSEKDFKIKQTGIMVLKNNKWKEKNGTESINSWSIKEMIQKLKGLLKPSKGKSNQKN